ncbi:hypothetical protein [Burkholderia thailandensis]|uniref:hypothetical protein n=1 Tax=Burkholderia thailandensis TaxID=57975 RepID=UPI001D001CA2|nr:hypothetical protein [Burkholderia thailandensis]MCS3394280.1 hypothetical protein [Burkholderia thailandensis]MCS6427368.1 hypothetical protein [Burkholderia thailandensis]MCS6455733.1 hypothetical protein [Burkholderia thailandensis]MCS6466525.1 hypothetical protein [Burkholderia thailandensis]MCS6485343.1 hypothetical protein [Burkholderia thailandensis]
MAPAGAIALWPDSSPCPAVFLCFRIRAPEIAIRRARRADAHPVARRHEAAGGSLRIPRIVSARDFSPSSRLGRARLTLPDHFPCRCVRAEHAADRMLRLDDIFVMFGSRSRSDARAT